MHNIEIKNMKKVDNPKIRANFTLVIDDCVEIFNVKLIYSEKTNQFYVFPSSVKSNDKYFPNYRLSTPLQQKVLDAAIMTYSKL